MSRLNVWTKLSACAACLRGIAKTRRYHRYQASLESAIERLDASIEARDLSAARTAYLSFETLCDRRDALDAEVHRAILDCLNIVAQTLWRTT